MNPIELNEPLLDQFDLFSTNKLSSEDAHAFQLRLETDAAFKDAYTAYLVSKEAIETKIASTLRTKMKEWDSNKATQPGQIKELPHSPTKYKISWYKWSAAASILLVLAFSFNSLLRVKKMPEQMMAEHLEIPDNGTRSDGADAQSLDAIAADLKSNPAEAIEKIKNLVGVNELQRQSYLGKFYTRNHQYELAIQSFEKALALGDRDAAFAVLIVKFKSGDTGQDFQNQLDKIILDQDHPNNTDALKMKSISNSIWWKILN